jgi:hypothetical protein
MGMDDEFSNSGVFFDGEEGISFEPYFPDIRRGQTRAVLQG